MQATSTAYCLCSETRSCSCTRDEWSAAAQAAETSTALSRIRMTGGLSGFPQTGDSCTGSNTTSLDARGCWISWPHGGPGYTRRSQGVGDPRFPHVPRILGRTCISPLSKGCLPHLEADPQRDQRYQGMGAHPISFGRRSRWDDFCSRSDVRITDGERPKRSDPAWVTARP